MKKIFILLTLAVMMSFASCEKYDHAIADIEDRLDKIEGTDLTTIYEQIAAINGSISNLQAVDAELKGYILSLQSTATNLQTQIDATNDALAALKTDLEGQIADSEQKMMDELNVVKTALESELNTINNTIIALQEKDAELDKKIADLQTYVDSELSATKDWANATFSTLEQYQETQAAISAINALIQQTTNDIKALEEKLNKKIEDDIAAAIEGVNADIAAKVTAITDAYTAAIAAVKDEITKAYTDAIATAITASETTMKEWVNSILAESYYDKAKIEGLITALQTKLTEEDEALGAEIDALRKDLETATAELTAAYELAIEDAINENNGKISAEIAAAVKTAQDKLQTQIDAINEDITKIKARLDIIEQDIRDIQGQIAAINASITDLQAVDEQLNGYITDLQATADNLQSQIDATNDLIASFESDLEGMITASEQKMMNELNVVKTALESELNTINNTIIALQTKDEELNQKIEDLRSYIDGQLQNYATTEWANATFSTLEQYQETQAAISAINALIQQTTKDIEALEKNLNKKIEDDIAAAIEGVNADIAAQVTAITDAYTAAIAAAKDEITTAYTDAIATAITASETTMMEWVNSTLADGYYDQATIDGMISALETQIQNGDADLQEEINKLKEDLENAKKGFDDQISTAITTAIGEGGVITTAIAAQVNAATTLLQNQINEIKGDIAEIKSRLDVLEKSVADIQEDIANLLNMIQSVTFVPDYSDGIVKMDFQSKTAKFTFRISPQSAVTVLLSEGAEITMCARYTADPLTRAEVGQEVNMVMSEPSGNSDNGIYSFTASGAGLGNEFWSANMGASAYLHIKLPNGTDITSDYIPMIPYSYTGGGSITADEYDGEPLPNGDANATDN